MNNDGTAARHALAEALSRPVILIGPPGVAKEGLARAVLDDAGYTVARLALPQVSARDLIDTVHAAAASGGRTALIVEDVNHASPILGGLLATLANAYPEVQFVGVISAPPLDAPIPSSLLTGVWATVRVDAAGPALPGATPPSPDHGREL